MPACRTSRRLLALARSRRPACTHRRCLSSDEHVGQIHPRWTPDDRSAVGQPSAGVAYLHNDIDTRPESEDEKQRCLENGWQIDDPAELQAWRDQEPINAHSHLAAMLLGSSEVVPVCEGKLVLGQWQSVMLVDLDGPRERTVGLQLVGFR